MKPVIPTLCACAMLIASSSALAGEKSVSLTAAGGHAFIKSIKSPQELLFPHFPKKYCVPVTLSGRIADEMRIALDSLKMDLPTYNEFFDGKEFHLTLAYAAKTRELLSGMLNPVEMIDIVVTSVVKYREGQKYEEIIRDTHVKRDSGSYNGRKALVVQLTPKGERFAYVYQDMGAFVTESWLTMMTLTIDAATNVVYELSTIRYSRTYGANAAKKPSADITNARYVFNYDQKEGILLPSRLTVQFNNAEVLRIDVTYKKQDKVFVFVKKEICTSMGGIPMCLIETYGDYKMGACDTTAGAQTQKKPYSKQLEQAAQLSRDASEKLRKGQISETIRLLQKLIEQYGGTPQAIEAKRLLSQLPKELQ